MRLSSALTLLAASAAIVAAQTAPQPASNAPAPQRAPRAPAPPDPPAALEHIARAKTLAGSDLPKPLLLCDPTKGPAATYQQDKDHWLEPTRVFDNLYYVGSVFVGSWIIRTSKGLILFDSLESADEARDRLVPGLRKLGLDPATIKYVLVTHGHWDHYGGAQYLHDTFGPRIALSEPDWHLMATMGKGSPELGNVPPPNKDLVITDGMKVTLGDTTVTLYVTPGHSPGTISALIPVREGRKTHVLSLLGGTAFPVTLEPSIHGGGLLLNSQSVERLASLSRAAGADGIINTHINSDGSYDRLQLLAKRVPGAPNPFVIGPAAVARHYGVFDECLKAAAERVRARS